MKSALKLTFLSLILALGAPFIFGQSASPVWAGEDQWTTSSLAGFSTFAVTIDPTNSDIVYVGTDRGMLLSQNGGQSWRGFPGLTGQISSILVDTANPDTLFIISNNQLLKSSDGGRSWSVLGEGVLIRPSWVGAHPLRPEAIYVRTSDGLFRSPDGGVTWSGAGLPVAEQTQAVAFDPTNADVMYAALAGGEGLFRTGDGGQSWSLISGSLEGQGSAIYRMSVDSSGTLFVQTRAGIYRSADGGQSWQLSSMEETVRSYGGYLEYTGFAVDGAQPNVLYHGWERSLLRSRDGGATWEQFNDVLPQWPVTLVADPQQEGRIYAIVGDGYATWQLHRSVDGGATWQAFQPGAGFRQIEAHPGEAGTVFGLLSGRDNSVWHSQGGTQSWQLSNAGLEEAQVNDITFDPTNTSIAYAGTQAGLYRSIDGGKTWTLTGLPANVQVFTIAVDPQTNTNLYVGGSSGLLRSINNGESWTAASAVSRNVTGIVVNPEAPEAVYAVANGQLHRSQDRGESWNVLSHPGQQIFSVALKPDDPNTIYTSARDGLYISRDGGSGWSKAPVQATSGSNLTPVLRMDPRRPEALYMGWGTEIFISPDAGNSWLPLAQGAPGLAVNDLTVDAGEPLTLYATFGDGAGSVWQYTLTNLPEPPTPTPTSTAIPTATPRATSTPFPSPTSGSIASTATALAMNRADPESTAAAVFGLDQDESAAESDRIGALEEGTQPASLETSTSIWPILGGILLLAMIVGGGFFVWRYAQATTYSEPPPGMIACPNCDAMVPPGARFCARCGHRMQRENEAAD